MTVKVSGRFVGGKTVELRHAESGATFLTDAPKDNQGEGKYFSPTDLLPAALGSCALTVMAIYATRAEIDLSGMYFEAEKTMSTDPRRIGRIAVELHLPQILTALQREKLERVAHTCPVHHSLHPEIEAPLSFVYDI